MKLTLGQVKEILPLSQDTYRYWKSTIAPLAGRNGHTRCFSAGDLLAMAAVKTLTEDLGIQVGTLQPFAADLFAHCNQNSWAALERSTLVFELAGRRVDLAPDTQSQPLDRVAFVVPCRPMVMRLQERLALGLEDSLQEPLRFPPTALATARRGGRTR
jgi:DNA-binding transcriptional MerR regulator